MPPHPFLKELLLSLSTQVILVGLQDIGPWLFGLRGAHVIQVWTFKLQQLVPGWPHGLHGPNWASQVLPCVSLPWNWREKAFLSRVMNLERGKLGTVNGYFSSRLENTCVPYMRKRLTSKEKQRQEMGIWCLIPAVVWLYELIKCPFCFA